MQQQGSIWKCQLECCPTRDQVILSMEASNETRNEDEMEKIEWLIMTRRRNEENQKKRKKKRIESE